MEKTNITLRKHKSKSVTDLSIIIDECNINYSNPFDTSTLSLPNTSITENDYTKSLQEQINEQKLLLESANEEVERLSLENIELKKTLVQRENTLSLLKKIGICENSVMSSPVIKKIKNVISMSKTPTKTNSISPNKSIIQVINLENKIKKLEEELEEANSQIEKLNQNIKKLQGNVVCSTKKNEDKKYIENHSECTAHPMPSHQPQTKIIVQNGIRSIIPTYSTKRKIFIIADQQGRGVRHCLQNLIGDEFLVTCLWKPGARMCDLLSSYKQELLSLTSKDYVILMGGINDKNPFEFKCNIEVYLNCLSKTNVIISEIPYNKLLNEKKLNYELRYICNRHKNCIFVEMGFDRFLPYNSFFSTFICRSLLREILRNEYRIKINAYKITNNQVIIYNCINSNKLLDKSTQTEEYIISKNNNLDPLNINTSSDIVNNDHNQFFLVQ